MEKKQRARDAPNQDALSPNYEGLKTKSHLPTLKNSKVKREGHKNQEAGEHGNCRTSSTTRWQQSTGLCSSSGE